MSLKGFKFFRGYGNLPSVNIHMNTVEVERNGRRMVAHWTPEMAQDVSAFHNIDVEAELTALLSEQIAVEVDREILRTILNKSTPFKDFKFGK